MGIRYSPLKAMKYPDRLEAIKKNEVAGPVHVQIILSDLCNQNCHFCAYRDPSYTSSQLFHVDGNYNPNRKLPFVKAVEILDDCKELGVKAIQLTGGGEPTIHPDFGRVVEEIEKRGFKWGLVTNGVKPQDLSSATWVRVSLDAATPETYSMIRSVAPIHFQKACETIAKWKTGVGFVITPENWREVLSATKLAKALGASNIRIGAQFSEQGEDLFSGFRHSVVGLVKEAETLADDGFEVINRFSEKMEDLHLGRPNYKRCGYQHFTTYIGADQNLYRCCIYAYNPRGLIGTIKDKRFKDAWKLAHEDFQKFNAQCCTRCQFNTINRAINDVLESDPSEEFV